MSTAASKIGLLIGIVSYCAAKYFALETFEGTWFRHAPSDPPWYFIGLDLVSALWCLAGLLVMIGCCFLLRRRLGPQVWEGIPMLLLLFSVDLSQGVNVALRTRNAWNSSTATTDWQTFEAYIHDKTIFDFGALLVVGLALWYFQRRRPSPGETTA